METATDDTPARDIDAALPALRTLVEQGQFQQALGELAPLLSLEPAHRDLLYLRAVALRMLRQIPEAMQALDQLEARHPTYPRLFQERGHCHVFRRDAPAAIAAFERATALNPALPASWNTLAGLYRMTGRTTDAERAAEHAKRLASLPVEVVTARSMLADGNLLEAEQTIRRYLLGNREDIEGMRVLANIAVRNEYPADAEVLLESVLELAPDYHAARYDLVLALVDLHKHARARDEVLKLIAAEAANPAPRVTLASILLALGEIDEAVRRYRELIAEMPQDAEIIQSLGHALKTRGDTTDAVEAYRNAAAARPGFGEPFWSLANLKTYRFTDAEFQRMRELESRPVVQLADHYHLCFALGKGLEDRGECAESFTFYARGNALKKSESGYRAGPQERSARRQRELCTPEFFAQRTGWGCPDSSPIFVLGMPRAGSTLLEQILASHSQVEGTTELANIPRLVGALSGRERPGDRPYPDLLADLTDEQCHQFGEDYLRDTLAYRSGKPFFIDKMPNNFRNIGLIQLILPNAKIIDARRDAMDCCFGNFKQLYARGHQFAYDLEDIGRYYALYLQMMEHWERTLPGRVLRVQHEDVLDDLEGSVRRMLDYCGLPFEAACLEFHRTERRVHTASAAQVRRPLNREGVGAWQPYEPWLGPLREALGHCAQ